MSCKVSGKGVPHMLRVACFSGGGSQQRCSGDLLMSLGVKRFYFSRCVQKRVERVDASEVLVGICVWWKKGHSLFVDGGSADHRVVGRTNLSPFHSFH